MKLLYNPFEKISENILLLIGTSALIIGSLLAWALNCRFTAILNIQPGTDPELWQPLADNLIIIALLTILLLIFGLIANKKTRPVDVFTAVLMGRIPFYLLTLANINNFLTDITNSMLAKNPVNPIIGTEYIIFIIVAFASLAMVAWGLVLLYSGFKVAVNAKHGWHTIIFIITIVVADALSGLLILLIP